jgi:hypothetical protein
MGRLAELPRFILNPLRLPGAGDGRQVQLAAKFGHEISRQVSVECGRRCLVREAARNPTKPA